MGLKRGTRITIETERTVIVRQTRSARAWCEECQRQVDFVQLQQRQQLLRKTSQEMADGSSLTKLHLAEQEDGSVLICLESWMKCG
jgi:hypothetical protein